LEVYVVVKHSRFLGSTNARIAASTKEYRRFVEAFRATRAKVIEDMRAQGMSEKAIAEELEISRQALHQSGL
jgi:DNA-binding NarL/FixJ family response regulator